MNSFDKLAYSYARKAIDAVRDPLIRGLGGVTKSQAKANAIKDVGKSHMMRAYYSNAIRPLAAAGGAAIGGALGLGAMGTMAAGVPITVGAGMLSRAAWKKGKAFLAKRKALQRAAELAKMSKGERALSYIAARPLKSGVASMAVGGAIGHAGSKEKDKEKLW